MRKRSIVCLRLLFSFILLSAFFSCENDIEKIRLITEKKIFPSESGKDVEMLYSDSAKLLVHLTAKRMDHYPGENPYLEMPEGVAVVFYDDSMHVKSRLTSNYAVKMEKERKIEAKKNVVVVNEKGDMLNTEHLIWDEQTGKIMSDEFVKITTKDEIIYGQGFESNQTFTKYKINKIKGNIQIKH